MLTQTGYLGSVGPVFITSNDGYLGVTIIQGEFENSKLIFKAKRPEYATNLRSFGNNTGSNYFEFSQSECTLGSYSDNQKIAFNIDSYRVTAYDGNSYEDYRRLANDWVTVKLTTTPAPVQNPVPLPSPTPGLPISPYVEETPTVIVDRSTPASQQTTDIQRPLIIGAKLLTGRL